MVKVIWGTCKGVPVDDGRPVVPGATIIIVGSRGVGKGAVFREVEVIDGIHVHHVHGIIELTN